MTCPYITYIGACINVYMHARMDLRAREPHIRMLAYPEHTPSRVGESMLGSRCCRRRLLLLGGRSLASERGESEKVGNEDRACQWAGRRQTPPPLLLPLLPRQTETGKKKKTPLLIPGNSSNRGEVTSKMTT